MWHVWETGEMHAGYGGKPGGKRPLGRTRIRWEDNNKMHLQGVVWRGMGSLILLRIGTGGGHL